MTSPDGRPVVVFVHPSDELFGADRCLLEMVRGLLGDVRVVVVLPCDVAYEGRLSAALIPLGVEIQRIDFAVLRRAQLSLRHWPGSLCRMTVGTFALARLIRSVDARCVQTNTLAAISGPLAALLTRRAHVWHVHEMIADERWLIRGFYRVIALSSVRIVANSYATARALAGSLRTLRRRTTVVCPGVAVGDELRERSQPTGPVRLGYVGRLAPRKGVAELLEAFALLREREIDVTLHVVGEPAPRQSWRLAQLRRRAAGLGLDGVVHFSGFCDDVSDVLRNVDVLVVPSQRPEPFGLVVLEGMAAGCAVVVSRNGGGSDEILRHGVTGLYCERSPASIACAIMQLVEDPLLRIQMGQAAIDDVRHRFSVDRYVEATRRMTMEMIAKDASD